MLTFRSVLFTAFLWGSGLIGGLSVMLLFWAPAGAKWAVARAWANSNLWAGRVLCGLNVRTEGSENIPDAASVALIKHTTAVETYWQIAALPPQTWVLKKELLRLPFFGWGIALVMNPIAIDRKAGGTAVKQVIREGRERIAAGRWLTIFPEGTRMPPGETRRYGISGAAVAVETGCLIVPVAHNAGDFWPRRGLRKYPGNIVFSIGPPIDPSGKTAKEVNELAQTWVESRMREISHLYRKQA